MTPFVLSQILAALTLITGMTAFQFKQRKHILLGWCVAATLAATGGVEAGGVTVACQLEELDRRLENAR